MDIYYRNYRLCRCSRACFSDMESIDLVIVANSFTVNLWVMTAQAIKSARKYAGMEVGKIVVMEQSRSSRDYPDAKTIRYTFEFNYNKCLNAGRSFCQSKYIAFCNNDLYFENNWAVNAVNAMKENNLMSVSPTRRHIFQGVRLGYRIGVHVLGWCIIVDRKIFDYIGQFDEPVNFWFSDNVYAVQLQCAGIKHGLVGNSLVRHYTSRTDMAIRNGRKERRTGQKELFDKYKKEKYAENIKVKAEDSNSD